MSQENSTYQYYIPDSTTNKLYLYGASLKLPSALSTTRKPKYRHHVSERAMYLPDEFLQIIVRKRWLIKALIIGIIAIISGLTCLSNNHENPGNIMNILSNNTVNLTIGR